MTPALVAVARSSKTAAANRVKLPPVDDGTFRGARQFHCGLLPGPPWHTGRPDRASLWVYVGWFFFDWKVLLEALTACAWQCGSPAPDGWRTLPRARARLRSPLSARRELLSQMPGRTRQSFPGSIPSPPPVSVRAASVEDFDPENRASSSMRFAATHRIAFKPFNPVFQV